MLASSSPKFGELKFASNYRRTPLPLSLVLLIIALPPSTRAADADPSSKNQWRHPGPGTHSCRQHKQNLWETAQEGPNWESSCTGTTASTCRRGSAHAVWAATAWLAAALTHLLATRSRNILTEQCPVPVPLKPNTSHVHK